MAFEMLALVLLLPLVQGLVEARDTQLYIVYMGRKQHEDALLNTKLHHETLAGVLGSMEMAREAIIHSYRHGFSGFAARMTSHHADIMSKMPAVLAVFPSGVAKLRTTHSWDFMGVFVNDPHGHSILEEAKYGADVIIGVVDSGIWPEAESFHDRGMPPIPKRFKGACQSGEEFNSSHCNRKIIGARFFNQGYLEQFGKNASKLDYQSPRDTHSHGTHTASTAAGRLVKLGDETARGGAPMSRLAIYKALYAPSGSGSAADVLAAIDHAINDGVHIISFSGAMSDPLISLATFHAAEHGILFIAAAGNSGSTLATVTNTAPWILTVAASSTDRAFEVPFQLSSNNKTYKARYLGNVTADLKTGWQKLVYATSLDALIMNDTEVRGSYVVFKVEDPTFSTDKLEVNAYLGGALGVITVMPHLASVTPWFQVSPSVFSEIQRRNLVNEESMMINFGGITTVFGDPAPKLARFSSRGPGQLFPDILKPDVTAPGVDILAAVPPQDLQVSRPSRTFDRQSGTSMSCPHVSGVAALIKSVHPDWSPAAIKSAIMTTASIVDNTGDIISDTFTGTDASPLGYGAGHVDPVKATDPGLVYDTFPEEYERFMCALGYIDYPVDEEKERAFNCSLGAGFDEPSQLNHPSISISNLAGSRRTVRRVVNNVGLINSTYKVTVEEPYGVRVTVRPAILEFNESVRKLPFEVTFEPTSKVKRDYTFGSITWSDCMQKHSVRSPVVVQNQAT